MKDCKAQSKYVCTLHCPATFGSWPLPVNKEYINCHLKDELVEKLDSLDTNIQNIAFH